MWKIHAGGLPIFSGAEADCRRLYLGYNEWQVWQELHNIIERSDGKPWTLQYGQEQVRSSWESE